MSTNETPGRLHGSRPDMDQHIEFEQPELGQPAAEAAPESPAPTIWDRLRGVKVKKIETARQVYLRLLPEMAAGKDLSEKELASFAQAMTDAGITEATLKEHRELLRRAAENPDAIENEKQLTADLEATRRELADHNAKKYQPAFTRLTELQRELSTLEQKLYFAHLLATEHSSFMDQIRGMFGGKAPAVE